MHALTAGLLDHELCALDPLTRKLIHDQSNYLPGSGPGGTIEWIGEALEVTDWEPTPTPPAM
jgi:hypothetical protein